MKLKKAILASATMAVVVGALAGCSTAAADSSSLELWMPPFATGSTSDEDEWNAIVAGFEEENDVDVNVTIVPWETFADKLLAGFSGGQGPDVVYLYNELIGDYLQRGALAPLEMDGVDTSDYLYLDRGVVDGEQYSLPFMVGGARVLFYNQDLLTQAGVAEAPTTWDEFLAAGDKLTAAGITPLAQSWGDPAGGVLNDTFYPLLWQAGGELLSEDGSESAFNSPEGLAAAEYLLELNDSGMLAANALSTTTDEAIDAFATGEVAFFVQVDAEKPTFTDAGINVGWVDALTGAEKATFVATDSLVTSASCADAKLCTDLAVYLTSAPQMEAFHSWAEFGPINVSEASDSEFESVYAQTDITRSLPVAAGSPEGYNALYSNLQQMLLGEKTPKQALADAAETADAALADAQK